MKKLIKFLTPPRFVSYAAVGGYEEMRGPIGDSLDLCCDNDLFGQESFELAEGEMCRLAFNASLKKCGLDHGKIELVLGGDLQNQCVATSVGLSSFGLPFLGLYGACSTCTEALVVAGGMLSTGAIDLCAAVTSSHNSAAERQFRGPVEYGGIRTPSSQWTATAAGSFILSTDLSVISASPYGNVELCEAAVGRVIDGGTKDASNMGAAMAFAAADSIIGYFGNGERDIRSVDLIVTGDLGKVGSDILRHILRDKLPEAAGKHTDCGLLLYDMEKQDVHSGASGCGTSAALLACHFLPKLESGDLRDILFLSTGAMMSQSSVLQGSNICGVAPLVRLRYSPKKG